jgi:putative ABC transport system permease protein
MPFFVKARSLLRNLFLSRRVEVDLDQEVRSHLEMLTEENIRAGMPPREAQRAARIELGGIEQLKEQVREERIGNWLRSVLSDCRYGVRQVCRNASFTAVAVLTLALGIGATTVMFSVIYNLLYDPFPYKGADRLMVVNIHDLEHVGARDITDFSIPDCLEYQKQNRVFEEMIGYDNRNVLYSDGLGTRKWSGAYVTANSFDFYGLRPVLGRGIGVEDRAPNAPPVFAMNYKLWKAEFNGDPAIVGKSFNLDGKLRTLVGIMPPRFQAYGASVWLPIDLRPGGEGTIILGSIPASLFAIGRLKAGVTQEAAAADFDTIARRLATLHPKDFPERFSVIVQKLVEADMGKFRSTLYALLGAVVMLLLIACSNVAHLLLARATTREREIAIRASMGASSGRLIRQLLVESLLLALAACAAGCAFAYFGLRGVVAMIPHGPLPDEAVVGLNPVVLLFALALSVLTTLICGIVPALHAVRGNLHERLTSSGKGVNGSFRLGRFRSALAIAEVSLSVVLLAGAGLMARSFFALRHVDLGFNPENVLYARLGFPEDRYDTAEQKKLFIQQALERVKAIPGVISVTHSFSLPPNGMAISDITVPGKTHPQRWDSQVDLASDGYYQTLGVHLMRGRLLSQADVDSAGLVAVVNEALVHSYFPNEDPIGQKIKFNGFDRLPRTVHGAYFEIVGVIADYKNNGLQDSVMQEAILPYTISGLDDRDILARTAVPPGSLLSSVRREVWAVDSNVAVTEVGSLKALLQETSYAQPQFDLVVTGAFAAIGLALVVIGVFSLMAYTVSLQTHEIGIRLALGATQKNILKMVLTKGLALVSTGLAIGLVGSLWLTRLISSQIWGVSGNDPRTLCAVLGIILSSGFAACLLPARRATRVDPMIALRYE